jgi:hypothetical protein
MLRNWMIHRELGALAKQLDFYIWGEILSGQRYAHYIEKAKKYIKQWKFTSAKTQLDAYTSRAFMWNGDSFPVYLQVYEGLWKQRLASIYRDLTKIPMWKQGNRAFKDLFTSLPWSEYDELISLYICFFQQIPQSYSQKESVNEIYVHMFCVIEWKQELKNLKYYQGALKRDHLFAPFFYKFILDHFPSELSQAKKISYAKKILKFEDIPYFNLRHYDSLHEFSYKKLSEYCAGAEKIYYLWEYLQIFLKKNKTLWLKQQELLRACMREYPQWLVEFRYLLRLLWYKPFHAKKSLGKRIQIFFLKDLKKKGNTLRKKIQVSIMRKISACHKSVIRQKKRVYKIHKNMWDVYRSVKQYFHFFISLSILISIIAFILYIYFYHAY